MKSTFTILVALSFVGLSACGGEPTTKQAQLYEHEYWELSFAECPKVQNGVSREENFARRQCSIAFYEKNKGLLRRDQVPEVKSSIDQQRKYVTRHLERQKNEAATK